TLARRGLELARESGALSMLPKLLGSWAWVNLAAGDFVTATNALGEAHAVTEATGASMCEETSSSNALLDAWHFEEHRALSRISELEDRFAGANPFFDCARARVYNAAGRYDAALEAAQRSCERHPSGTHGWALVELVEAAARSGELERAQRAFA